MTDTTTDHSEIITALRKWPDNVEYIAASDLLELHDRTSLNLGQAPRLKRFVEKYAAYALLGPVVIEDNGA